MKIHKTLSVNYETQILENGRIVKKRPLKRNLILDIGLDRFASVRSVNLTRYCALGDGNKPTKRDSGDTTFSITNEVATASAGYFEPADVGRLLKLDSGQEVYIGGFNSPTEVIVPGAIDDAASEGTIWYVNDIGHENELIRTNDISTDSGDNVVSFDGTTYQIKRTFIFPIEESARTYREIGWADENTGNLFGRDLIPGVGDSISPGQQYKVIVILNFTVEPSARTAVSDVGTGWDTSGEVLVTSMLLSPTFENSMLGGSGELEPSLNQRIAAFSSMIELPNSAIFIENSINTPVLGTVIPSFKQMDPQSYVPGSLQRRYIAVFKVNESNGSWAGIGIGNSSQNWQGKVGFALKFTNPQTKDSDHTLTLKYLLSWGRNLVN